jgi:hypothetical protein
MEERQQTATGVGAARNILAIHLLSTESCNHCMEVIFVTSFAPIAADPPSSSVLHQDSLDLPLKAKGDYLSMEGNGGAKHYGVWPLRMAAQSCFGTYVWPPEIPTPQATIEFELRSVQAVPEAVGELVGRGCRSIHEAREEPWGQTVARLLSPDGLLIGLSYAPWLHE